MIKLDEEKKKKKNYNSHGLGTYYMRGDRYEWRLTQDGIPRYASAKTKPELELKIKRIKGTTAQGVKITVDEWFDNWLENYVKDLRKDATYQQYRNLYDKHVKPYIGNRKLVSITPNDVQGLIARMNKIEDSATWTMKHVRKILHVGYERVIEFDKLIKDNPVHKIEIPKKQAKSRKPLITSELALLFDSMNKSRWIWSAKFDMVTALRRGELLALKWCNIDILNKRALIEESDSDTGLGDLKQAEPHYIPLSDMAIEYLEKQQEMLINEGNINKVLVFPNQKGEMMNPHTYYNTFSRFARRVGLKASPHSMRHTFVFFTRGTIELKDLQHILGHARDTQTTEMYGNMINDTNDKNIKSIDTAFTAVNEQIKEEKKKTRNTQLRRVK